VTCLRDDPDLWVRLAAAVGLRALCRRRVADDAGQQAAALPSGAEGTTDPPGAPETDQVALLARQALIEAASEASHPWVRALALWAVGDDAPDDAVVGALAHPDWVVRFTVTTALEARLSDEQVAALLQNTNAGVRVMAALALEARQNGAHDTPAPETAFMPAESMLGQRPAVEPVIAALLAGTTPPQVRTTVGAALGALAAVDAWAMRAVGQEHDRLRLLAVEVLALLSPLSASTVQPDNEHDPDTALRLLRRPNPDSGVRADLGHVLALRELGQEPPPFPPSGDVAGRAIFELSFVFNWLLRAGLSAVSATGGVDNQSPLLGRVARLQALLASPRWDVQQRAAERFRAVTGALSSEDVAELMHRWEAATPAVREALGDALAIILTKVEVAAREQASQSNTPAFIGASLPDVPRAGP
jgi:hypothetical protein